MMHKKRADNGIYRRILDKKSSGIPALAILIDPEKTKRDNWEKIIQLAIKCKVDFLFVGGSRLDSGQMAICMNVLKSQQDIPVVIFPGNEKHIHPDADALLLLSVISGRNADMLIGKHVSAAKNLISSDLEIIPTGYILFDSGVKTSVVSESKTIPIKYSETDLTLSTAIAGELLGMKLIYMEAGSGAKFPVPSFMIKHVKAHLNIPLIVGGGLNTEEKFRQAIEAGADLVVVGNILEKEPALIEKFCLLLKEVRSELNAVNHKMPS